jgi:hypothetical protein
LICLKIRFCPNSLLSIFLQHSGENVPGLGRRRSGNAQRLAQRLLVHFVLIFAVEWREAKHHLIEDAAQTPPVHCPVIWLLLNHFRC